MGLITMKDYNHQANDFNLLKLPESRCNEGNFRLKTRMMITRSLYSTLCDYLSIRRLNTPPLSHLNKVFNFAQ